MRFALPGLACGGARISPLPLARRLLPLLAIAGAVAAAAAFVAGAHADEGGDASGPAAALLPTQAIAEVPEEFDALFEIQWGGGILYQLKARLATMGCMLNTIWIQAGDHWYGYNQYNVPPSLNKAFLDRFSDHVPATGLYGTCIDICTFETSSGTVIEGRRCSTFEEHREQGHLRDYERILNLPITDDTPCNDDFDPRVKQHVFPILPLLPNTCIVRQTSAHTPSLQGRAGRFADGTGAYVVVWSNPTHFRTNDRWNFSRTIS